MKPLADSERQRYQRQMLISEWGETGQQKIRESVVCVAGAGGLGSPVTLYLAAAGVGTLRLVDNDSLDLSNLNRQILYGDDDIGHGKASSAVRSVRRLNPNVAVVDLGSRIAGDTVGAIVGDADLIVDCMDNFEARYVLNKHSVKSGIPLIHGGVMGFSGQTTFLTPPETPCLHCIVPEPPPREVFPIVGATAGVIGSIQALEALKYLTGVGTLLTGRLLVWDGESMEFFEMAVEKNPDCPVCADTKVREELRP